MESLWKNLFGTFIFKSISVCPGSADPAINPWHMPCPDKPPSLSSSFPPSTPVLYFMFNLAKEKGFLVLLPSNLVKADGACVTQISRGTFLSFLRAPDGHRNEALVQPEGPTGWSFEIRLTRDSTFLLFLMRLKMTREKSWRAKADIIKCKH